MAIAKKKKAAAPKKAKWVATAIGGHDSQFLIQVARKDDSEFHPIAMGSAHKPTPLAVFNALKRVAREYAAQLNAKEARR